MGGGRKLSIRNQGPNGKERSIRDSPLQLRGFARRKVAGVEYIGYDEKSGHLKTHVFGNLGPDPLEYTWEIGEDPFTNWFGAVGSPSHYKGKFSEDRNTITGAWEWPGGGYEATMTRVE